MEIIFSSLIWNKVCLHESDLTMIKYLKNGAHLKAEKKAGIFEWEKINIK